MDWQGLLSSFLTPDLYSYVIVIVLSSALVSKSGERFSLAFILACYLTSPYIRTSLPFFKGPIEDFYAFYAAYEVFLLFVLTVLNSNSKRLPEIYILHLSMACFNSYIYLNFYSAYWQTEYYYLINKISMDLTILFVASSLRRQSVILVSCMLMLLPPLLYLLQTG